MKILRIGAAILLIAFSLFLCFGIVGYSVKEGDEDIFTYLIIPLPMLAIGIYLIAKRK